MSQTWQSNGSHDDQQGDYETLTACGILGHTNPLEAQNNNGAVIEEPHIVLLIGPHDDDNDQNKDAE